MIYAIRVYTVDVARVPVFLAAFRSGGLWTDIARLQPGHIHADLLRNPSDSTKSLSIEFWASIPALSFAKRSSDVRSFGSWLQRQSIKYEGLGMFVFPPNLKMDEISPSAVPCALESSLIEGYLSHDRGRSRIPALKTQTNSHSQASRSVSLAGRVGPSAPQPDRPSGG